MDGYLWCFFQKSKGNNLNIKVNIIMKQLGSIFRLPTANTQPSKRCVNDAWFPAYYDSNSNRVVGAGNPD